VGTAPALAEGTPSIESASEAERAAAARPEALEPRVHEWRMVRQGTGAKRHRKARLGVKSRCMPRDSREGEREPDVLPPEGWHKREVLPQEGGREGGREIDAPPQESPDEGVGVDGGREVLRPSRHKLEAPSRVDPTKWRLARPVGTLVGRWLGRRLLARRRSARSKTNEGMSSSNKTHLATPKSSLQTAEPGVKKQPRTLTHTFIMKAPEQPIPAILATGVRVLLP
jgi:hypothetical protein